LWTFIAFVKLRVLRGWVFMNSNFPVVDQFEELTTKATKVHEGKPLDLETVVKLRVLRGCLVFMKLTWHPKFAHRSARVAAAG
jgi:hypothetical protein